MTMPVLVAVLIASPAQRRTERLSSLEFPGSGRRLRDAFDPLLTKFHRRCVPG